MRMLKRIAEIEFDTGAEVFDAGHRRIFVSFNQRGVHVRGSRQSARRFVSWQKLYDMGQILAGDFEPATRRGAIRRGKM